MLNCHELLSDKDCAKLGMSSGSTYAQAAQLLALDLVAAGHASDFPFLDLPDSLVEAESHGRTTATHRRRCVMLSRIFH